MASSADAIFFRVVKGSDDASAEDMSLPKKSTVKDLKEAVKKAVGGNVKFAVALGARLVNFKPHRLEVAVEGNLSNTDTEDDKKWIEVEAANSATLSDAFKAQTDTMFSYKLPADPASMNYGHEENPIVLRAAKGGFNALPFSWIAPMAAILVLLVVMYIRNR